MFRLDRVVKVNYSLSSREQEGPGVLRNLVRIRTCVATNNDLLVELGERDVIDAREDALNKPQVVHPRQVFRGKKTRPEEHEKDVDGWKQLVQRCLVEPGRAENSRMLGKHLNATFVNDISCDQ